MLKTALSILMILNSLHAYGQTSVIDLDENKKEAEQSKAKSEETEKKSSSAKSIERVQVTGSHIKRVDVEGASPVQTITRSDIEKTGYNSAADVLRDTTSNSFGSQREASGSNAAGVAHVDLRGLGSSNTLVLLNGQRLPSDAVTGAVDLNMIPTAAIERIEVLKDGASATYGSDALGGVVNIITRKDFNGTEVSFAQSTPDLPGGKKQEVSLVNGFSTDKLSMVNVLQYRDNTEVFSRDRKWTSNGFSNIGSPGSYRNAGGLWIADPNCPADRINVTPGGTFCKFKFSDYSTELPALEQLSVLSESNYEVNSRVRLKARLGGTQKKAQWSYAPAPDQFTIPAAVADQLGLPGTTPGQDLQVRYRLLELGTRDAEIETLGFNALLGTTVDIKDNTELELTTSHNVIKNKDIGVNGYALNQKLYAAIESGEFNPFAPVGQRGSLASARYAPTQLTTSQLTSVEAKVSSEIAELKSGAIAAAIGVNYTFQKYVDQFDDMSVNDEVFGNAGSSGGGQRDTRAVFTEVSVPLTKKLELQLAARYDQYSDFGDSTNPKLALMYKPNSNWLLRGSAGTGFKAPLMQDLYAATSNGFPTFIDHVSCKREREQGGATPSCLPQQYNVTSSGNTGLKEERSISTNLGAVYAPNSDFNISTDVFHTRLNNVVGISYDDAMKAEAMFGKGYLESQGVTVNRDGNGYIDSIEAPMQNLSAQEVSGIDLGTSVRVHSKVKLGIEHSHLFYFKQEGFPGTGLTDKLGENGLPPWRNTVSVTLLPNERHSLTLDALTIAGHQKTVPEQGKLNNFTTANLMYSYKSKELGTLTAGVRNLYNAQPPLDDSNPNKQLDTDIYDQIGQQIYTSYKATF